MIFFSKSVGNIHKSFLTSKYNMPSVSNMVPADLPFANIAMLAIALCYGWNAASSKEKMVDVLDAA